MSNVDVTALSNEELRDLLTKYGNPCGPIVKTTRKVYENKLKKLLSGCTSKRANSSPTKDQSMNSSSSGSGRGGGAFNRTADSFPDTSDLNEADRMEGEESFRYVGPVNDSPTSPYSALGGSMISTPPASMRTTTGSTTATGPRLDYNFQNTYSPPSKPSSGFTTNFSDRTSKTSSVSYHTAGSLTSDAYRRTNIPAALASRKAEPINPYLATGDDGLAKRLSTFNWDGNAMMARAKRWTPLFVKILLAVFLLIFFIMLIKRMTQDGSKGEEDEALKLPA